MTEKPQEKPSEKDTTPTATESSSSADGASGFKKNITQRVKKLFKGFRFLRDRFKKIRPWMTQKKEQLIEIIKNINSKDPKTRQAARAFFATLGFTVVLVIYGISRWGYFRWEEAHRHRVAEVEITPSVVFPRWTPDPLVISLKKPLRKFRVRSAAPHARVELSIECDTEATCQFLKDHLPQVKDRILGVLFGVEPDDFLTTEGKRGLQARMVEALQFEVPQGKIREVYFLNLSVE